MPVRLSRDQKIACVIIFLLIVGLFGSLINIGPLNWDDDPNIFQNPYYLGGFWRPYWAHPYFGLYIPVTTTIWHIFYVLGHGAAWPFRVMNLSLHLANSLLVFLLLQGFARSQKNFSMWGAVIGTAFFALHPLQVQAVAWLSGGRDLIASFFALLSLAIFFSNEKKRNVIGAAIFLVCGIFSKPNVVTVSPLMPLAALIFYPRRLRDAVSVGAIGLLGALVSAFVNLYAQRDFLTALHWWQRLFVMGDAYSFYVQKLVFPYPLSANYNRIPDVLLKSWTPYVRTLLFAGVAAGFLFYFFKKNRTVFWAAVAWLIFLLPVSGLVPFGYQKVSTPADHYHYLAMFAVSLAVASASRLKASVIYFFIGIFAVLTALRLQVWRSDKAFFDNMAAYAPKSYSTGMGQAVVKCKQEQSYQAGIGWIKVSLDERPDDIMALSNLAFCLFHAKDYTNTVALLGVMNRLDIPALDATQPTAFASFLASVGSALYEVHREEEGFQLICHAYRLKPSDPHNAYNLPIAAQILRSQGVEPTCRYPFTWPINVTRPKSIQPNSN